VTNDNTNDSHLSPTPLIVSLFGEAGVLSSPFWFTAEGAIIGLIIGYFATRFAGEGEETAGR